MRQPRIKKAPLIFNREPREGMSPSHLANVRQLPCLVCGRERPYVIVDPNHLMRLLAEDPAIRGMSFRSGDRWTVPTCRGCHRLVTDVGSDEAWYASRGFDARAVALLLWSNKDDLGKMRRIIERARQSAALRNRRGSD